MQDIDKLGVFYLGRRVDPADNSTTDEPILYDSRDLTTHAVCVGMTGSGKTGLCIGLLEEAAIDGIPAVIIDPKGDMANMMLNFPKLRAKDFSPWVNKDEAARKGLTVDEHAKKTADMWKQGLADWGQSPERIATLRDSVNMTVYTPGSSAGTPLQLLKSFSPPSKEIIDDTDLFQERIQSAVCSLLALVGIDADPIQSRECILLSNILNIAWKAGTSLSLEDMIRSIQNPGFDKVGVFDLESFYPEADRLKLAMQLNNLLASPGFEAWREGAPLDANSLLYSEDGKPNISIISIAHLSDSERMFFVTLLLNEMVSWMRTQPGTSSLRALLYMDEIYGYFPPTAAPPSKKPMLILLKQARAFGLGVVLSTQNPVDLDYKGLSNAGTWFIGRLQTEQDKARMLDGLEGVSSDSGGAFDRGQIDDILSGLSSRVFLLHNVHDEEPMLFKTRWALSYLSGPLTREQIRILKPTGPEIVQKPVAPQPVDAAPTKTETKKTENSPLSLKGIKQGYVWPTKAVPAGARLLYRPAIMCKAKVHYVKSTVELDAWEETSFVIPIKRNADKPSWPDKLDSIDLPETGKDIPDDAEFAQLPKAFRDEDNYKKWEKDFKAFIYRNCSMTVWKCKKPKAFSEPGMTQRAFRSSLDLAAREARDVEVEKVRTSYETKLKSLERKMEKAQARVEREEEQLGQTKMQTVIAIGSTLFGAMLGRKRISSRNVGRAATAMRTANRASRDKGDIKRAKEAVQAVNDQILDMEQQCAEDLNKIRDKYAPSNLIIEEVEVPPRKSDIDPEPIALAWMPWFIDSDGIAENAAPLREPTSEA